MCCNAIGRCYRELKIKIQCIFHHDRLDHDLLKCFIYDLNIGSRNAMNLKLEEYMEYIEYRYLINRRMLENDNELQIDKAEEVIAMTSLGKQIFVAKSSYAKDHTASSSTHSSQNSLSVAFENMFHMPYDIIESYGSTIHTLDLSHNKFGRGLHFLAEFENLNSLNLDHNVIDSFTVFPNMPKLELLWLNYNNIDELFPFIKNLRKSLPNLKFLSLMGNKAAPNYMSGGSFYDYLRYRLYVISWFPRLEHLDDRVITSEQRVESKRLFKRPFLEELFEDKELPDCLKYLHQKLNSFLDNSVDRFESSNRSNYII